MAIFNLLFAILFSSPLYSQNCTTSACHSDLKRNSFVHGPTRADGCVLCHKIRDGGSATSSDSNRKLHPRFLTLSPEHINQTCVLCHENKKSKPTLKIHKAIKEKSCVACHNPHSANNELFLKMTPLRDLCLSCHEGRKEALHFGHRKIVDSKKSCLNCHEAHSSQQPSLLKDKSKNLCLACHNQTFASERGPVLSNIEEQIKSARFVHQPINELGCQECHAPHGNAQLSFLKTEVPALCQNCHNPSKTQFRNGPEVGGKNLHEFHREKLKGEFSCSLCHEQHASSVPHLLRPLATYKGWKIPLQYKNSPDGEGSCTTVCHGEKRYNPQKNVLNKEGR